MTAYQLTHEGYVIRDGDTKVPVVDTPEFPNTNPDYLAYKQWLSDGGVPEPADPVPAGAPTSCTPAQGLIALFDLQGITETDINAMIDAIEDPALQYRARIAFTRASDWQKDHPVIQMLAQARGLTEAAVDNLFTYAASVNV